MNTKPKLLLLPALLWACCAFAQKTLLYCGRLIDPKTGQVLTEMTVVVTGNSVTGVSKGYTAASAGDKVIDLKNRTVMPGLIDAHVHLEDQTSPDRQLRGFTQNMADIAFNSTVYARTTLMAGFTTVRDVGGRGVNISLRNAINKGLVVGPRYIRLGRSFRRQGVTPIPRMDTVMGCMRTRNIRRRWPTARMPVSRPCGKCIKKAPI